MLTRIRLLLLTAWLDSDCTTSLHLVDGARPCSNTKPGIAFVLFPTATCHLNTTQQQGHNRRVFCCPIKSGTIPKSTVNDDIHRPNVQCLPFGKPPVKSGCALRQPMKVITTNASQQPTRSMTEAVRGAER